MTTRNDRRRAASPWVLGAAAVLLALAAAGLVFAVVLGDDDEDATPAATATTAATATSTVETLPQTDDVEELFDGIAQRGSQLGDPDAPAAMVEYVDVQCPYCASFDTQAMSSIIEDYVRPGKVFLELRPIATLGPDSVKGRAALVAAGLQGKFFQLAHLLYLNQGAENSGWLSEGLLSSAAASIGLDAGRFQADRNSDTAETQGAAWDAQARGQAVAVTPTIYVGPNGGELQQVSPQFPADSATIAKAIDDAIG